MSNKLIGKKTSSCLSLFTMLGVMFATVKISAQNLTAFNTPIINAIDYFLSANAVLNDIFSFEMNCWGFV